MNQAPSLLSIAQAVSDGDPVDWALAESTARTEQDRDALRALKSLSALVHADASTPAGWGPLELRELVGQGTFGRVFRAFDPRLEREVALKLIPDTTAGGAMSSSIIAEGRQLAKVRHANVVTVYGADIFDGSVGIWMEFVSGRTLKDLVSESGPLGAAEAAVIGRDLCRALAAVHKQGLIHQDVKAQNVMRESGGRTVLMDFGTAEAHSELPRGLRGTPAYLAPEVLAGGAPSVQSDVYSLGVLLFYLSTGTFPVVADSIEALHAHHQAGTRRRLADLRPELPAEFVRAVEDAMAPVAADRPTSAGDFEQRLRHVLEVAPATARSRWPVFGTVGALVAVVAVSAGWYWQNRPDPIALGQVAFGESPSGSALIGRIKQRLDEYGGLQVVDAAPARLDVTVDSQKVIARLVDRGGRELWAETFEATPLAPGALTTDAAGAIATVLRTRLSSDEWARIRDGARRNASAETLFLRARAWMTIRREEPLRKSLSFFLQSATKVPSFGLAHAGAAEANILLTIYRFAPRPATLAAARELAERAVALDPQIPEAHAILGYTRKLQFDWAGAIESFQHAVRLKPDYTDAHLRLATVYLQTANPDAALASMKAAQSLEPKSIAVQTQYAVLLLFSRRFEEAQAEAERVAALTPGRAGPYQTIAESLMYRGDWAAAETAIREAIRLEGTGASQPTLLADLALIHAGRGQAKLAADLLAQLVERHNSGSSGAAAHIASIKLSLGDKRAALDWLAISAHEGEGDAGYLLIDPRWDRLRGNSEFEKILKSVRLTR